MKKQKHFPYAKMGYDSGFIKRKWECGFLQAGLTINMVMEKDEVAVDQ